MSEGASVNVSAITMSPHVGTHADAPLHVRDGWPASEGFDLTAFSGEAIVCEVDHALDVIGGEHLPIIGADGEVPRLLLRTGCSIAGGAFPDRWPVVGEELLTRLLARGLVLLGVDAPSVDARDSTTLAVHRQLFAAGAWNLENLHLQGVPEGRYELSAYPLRLMGLDAAPVRAVLRPLR